MQNFAGIWVPLVTPFHQQQIDLPALQALAKRLTNDGVAGLVVCGSTGEAAALSDTEQLAVLDAVIDAVPDCPVVMGLAGCRLEAVRAQLLAAQARPIAGLLISPPSYIRPSQAGIVEYFRTLADAASVPIILYTIPYRTGVAMDLETIRTLARHPRIVAIKDCGGDPLLTMQLIHDGQLAVLAGEDHQIFNTLCLGGAGAIAASAHIGTDRFVQLHRLIQAQQLHDARELFHDLLPIMRLLFAEPNPAPIKAWLADMGELRNELRAPMQPASIELAAKLRQVQGKESNRKAGAGYAANNAAKRCAADLGSPVI